MIIEDNQDKNFGDVDSDHLSDLVDRTVGLPFSQPRRQGAVLIGSELAAWLGALDPGIRVRACAAECARRNVRCLEEGLFDVEGSLARLVGA